MLKYTWNLALLQPQNTAHFQKVQEALRLKGIFIDYAIEEGSPCLTVFIPEEGEDESGEKIPEISSTPEAGMGSAIPQSRKRGRPVSVPKNDLSMERVLNMRRLGVTADDIAKELGVSKRTYYRRLERLSTGKPHSYDTPFSEW